MKQSSESTLKRSDNQLKRVEVVRWCDALLLIDPVHGGVVRGTTGRLVFWQRGKTGRQFGTHKRATPLFSPVGVVLKLRCKFYSISPLKTVQLRWWDTQILVYFHFKEMIQMVWKQHLMTNQALCKIDITNRRRASCLRKSKICHWKTSWLEKCNFSHQLSAFGDCNYVALGSRLGV